MHVLCVPTGLQKWSLRLLQILYVPIVAIWLIVRYIVFQPVAYVLSLPMRPIGTVVSLVTHWAGDDRSVRWTYIFVGSLLISILTLLPFVGGRIDIVVLFFLSLFVHELFHGYGYYRVGIPYYIIFLGFLGAAAVVLDVLYNKMKHWNKSIMLLLGPVGSWVTAIAFWGLARLFPEHADTFIKLGGLNMTLVMFNMIALGGLDGGRIYLSMMASLREENEKYIAIPMGLVSIVVLVYAFLQSFRFELIIFFLVWILIGYVKTRGKDDPRDYLREPAMKTRETILVMLMYMTLLAVSSLMYPMFPDWSSLIVVDPFIVSHLPEIGMFLVVVGIYVLATDISHWKLKHMKYKTAVEIFVVFLMVGLSFVPAVFLAYRRIPVSAIWVTYVFATIAGYLSMRGMMRWKKIKDEILASQPKEPTLDVFEVVGDIA